MTRVVATLMDVMTGYVGRHEYDVEPEYVDSQEFMWADGNYACDCNRSIFLYGYELDDDPVFPCDNGNGQIALLSLTVGGVEVYAE